MKVKSWIDTVILPTFELGPDNFHPLFDGIEKFQTLCYPYPYAAMNGDRIFLKKKYKTLHLENEYLHLIALPEISGRIWSCMDKSTGKDIFHKAERVSVAYLPGGAGRGTYVGLGVEISYPYHHSYTNAIPREFSILENPDGSATIMLGELSLRGRVRWSVYLTLKPGEAVLYYKFLVHNCSNLFIRARYWGNASMPCESKNFECIFPERTAWEHGGEYGISTWPICDGIDMRFPTKNVPWPIGLEMKDVRDGFYGYYDHDEKYGMVHWANPAECPGKKYWAWGYSQHAIHRAHYFADGRVYLELQSGRCEDQEDFEVLEPFSTVSWDEFWYPVGDIDGISSAEKTIALNCQPKINKDYIEGVNLRLQSTIKQKIKIKISRACFSQVNVEKNVKIVKIGTDTIFSKNRIIAQAETEMEPQKPVRMQINFRKKLSLKDAFRVLVYDDKRLLLEYEHKDEKFYDNCIDKVISPLPLPKEPTPDQLVSDVEKMMRYHPRIFSEFEPGLKEAIKRDPEHSDANKYLGILSYKKGLIGEAREYLNKVFRRREHDGEAHFYSGLCYLKEGNEDEARWEFWKAVRYYKQELGYYYLGVLNFKDCLFEEAIEMFRKSLDYNANHINARVYLALCLATMGKMDDAKKEINEADKRFPRNPFIDIGKMLIEKGTLKSMKDLEFARKLHIQLHQDIQTYYELALDLAQAGLYCEALYLLKESERVCKNSKGKGFLNYYAGWLYDKLGDKRNAKLAFKKGQKSDMKYAFPFRLEEEEIIDTALKYDKNDAIAYYYSGLIRGAQERFKEAYELWQKALDLGLKGVVLYRGLGNIAIRVIKNEAKAIEYYESGLKLDPDDVQIRNDLVDIYQRQKNKNALLQLFKHPSTFSNTELIAKFISFQLSNKNYDLAVEAICNKANFPNQAQMLQPVYENVLVSRALNYMESGKFKEAIVDLEKALEAPPNLGYTPKIKKVQPKVKYFLGLAHQKSGDKDKAKKIWEGALKEQEGLLWEGAGNWSYGVAIDRYYQGRMLLELGRKEEAQVYFDFLRATALNKYPSRLSPGQRRELFNLAYEGRSEKELVKVLTDLEYLTKE